MSNKHILPPKKQQIWRTTMKIHKVILPLIDQDERRRSNIFATPDPLHPKAKWCTITSSLLLSSAAKSIHPSWHFLSRSRINERICFHDCVVNSGSLPGVSSRKPKIKLCITREAVWKRATFVCRIVIAIVASPSERWTKRGKKVADARQQLYTIERKTETDTVRCFKTGWARSKFAISIRSPI